MKPSHLTVLFGLLLAPWALAQDDAALKPTPYPFLWKIERDKPAYLFGTVHFPDKRVLALNPLVTEAAESCDALYTELDMDPAKMMKAQGGMMLKDGKRLKDVLPEDVYAKLKAFLKPRRMSPILFQQYTPIALSSQLPMLDRMAEMMQRQPMDMVLFQKAKAAGKEVGGIEELEEQINVFQSFNMEEQAHMLDVTLDELLKADETGEDQLGELLEMYLQGDEGVFVEMMNRASEDGEDPIRDRFHKLLLDDRNERMAERIDAKLKANEDTSYFFAVGAAHYAGKTSVAKLLRERGWKITRLPAERAGMAAKARAKMREIHAAGGKGDLPADPWGKAFKVEKADDPEELVVVSAGPDGQFGSHDDLRYWQ